MQKVSEVVKTSSISSCRTPISRKGQAGISCLYQRLEISLRVQKMSITWVSLRSEHSAIASCSKN